MGETNRQFSDRFGEHYDRRSREKALNITLIILPPFWTSSLIRLPYHSIKDIELFPLGLINSAPGMVSVRPEKDY